ncbi:hypothetical protein ERN12_09070 [Rhodobacteraceae bacterium]|nr:hypothetical protein ERN12_09070 [Paracoccaceae bacterium]
MTRHILDHARPKAEGNRLRQFVDLARKQARSRNAAALDQRPREHRGSRMRAYFRIERQITQE